MTSQLKARPMLILALDTTTRTGSVALTRNDELIDQLVGDPRRTHGERLPGDIIALLGRQRLEVSDIDLYAVAAGPGSFTGLRIGIATIQGLALVGGRLVVPVSTLDALAAAGRTTRAPHLQLGRAPWIAVWMDAQRRELFFALYRERTGFSVTEIGDLGGLELVDGPAVGGAEEALTRLEAYLPPHSRVHFIGDGALASRDELLTRPWIASVEDPVPPLAPWIAGIAHRRQAHGGAISPDAIRPLYVRRPDAELARDHPRR